MHKRFLISFIKQNFLLLLLIFVFNIININLTYGILKNMQNQNLETKTLGAKTTLNPSPKVKKNLSPTMIASPSPTISKTQAATNRLVYLGMWTEGSWNDNELNYFPEKLKAIEALTQKKVALAHFYTGWENLGKENILPQLERISSSGWRPLISINPYFTDNCRADGKTLYKAIADGNCDSLIREIGKTMGKFGKPIFLRFAWEMNIESMEWSIQKTSSSPEDYKGAWRRLHDLVVSEGGGNVLWVFSPNTITPTSIPYSAVYPGDQFVDWVALDGYNWGTTQSWSSWQSFKNIFSTSYSSLHAVAPSKPMMLAEVNSTDQGGNKAEWYKDMLLNQIPLNFPHIKAIVFYNENRMGQENVNWLINTTPESLSAFKTYIKNPIYRSSF